MCLAPAVRPGGTPDFSDVKISRAGEVRRPDVDVAPEEIRDLAFQIIRVLDRNSEAVGPWAGLLSDQELLEGLRHMMTLRAFDARMQMAQRQGKTSFYMQHLGEEAVSCAFRKALEPGDMNFPTYRQAGLLIAGGYPMLDMMNQIYSNELDPMKGRQLPVMYSSREHGFFSISGNLATQYIQAVGWAMASAMKRDTRIAAGWIGDGSTAESDFHAALVFASTYKAPVVLNIVNNQWAISTFQGIARGGAGTFAARGLGFGIPALRVDGNDYPAVHAVARWAVERARRNLGPTVIEYVTYRVGAHSSSTTLRPIDPRPSPMPGRSAIPLLRLKNHLIHRGVWSEDRHKQAEAEVMAAVIAAQKEAETHGTLHTGPHPSAPRHVRGRLRADATAPASATPAGRSSAMPRKTMVEAIRDAMDVAMQRDDNVVVFGEDVGYFGGVFRCTQGLQQKFGSSRCFDAPISESGIVGAAVGMAAYGLRPCVEIQFADYMYPGLRPDCVGSGAAALSLQRPVHRAAGRAHADRRRHLRRTDTQPEPGGSVHPCRRPQDRRAVQSLRCEGIVDRGDRGQRSGDLPRTQAAL